MANYFRRPGLGGSGLFPMVIKYLLVANISIFLIQEFFLPGLGSVAQEFYFRSFALWPLGSGFLPWQLFTYMFMHGGFMHLFLNMFILWMFGMELERMWGHKKFLLYYFMCGVGAGLANLIIAPLVSSVGPTVGASGAIYGILAAFGFLFPNRLIYIYFFIPVKAKYLIILYMVFDLFSIISQADTGIAHVAHLGGAVVGIIYLLVTKNKGYNFFQNVNRGESKFSSYTSSSGSGNRGGSSFGLGQNGGSPKKVKIKEEDYGEVEVTDFKKEMEDNEKSAQEKIDAILDKLSEGGYGSLTEEEKQILFQESKKLR